jgi:hypothetical protein
MLRPMVASSAGSPWNGLAMSRRARCSLPTNTLQSLRCPPMRAALPVTAARARSFRGKSEERARFLQEVLIVRSPISPVLVSTVRLEVSKGHGKNRAYS